jgi:hypothetical protein
LTFAAVFAVAAVLVSAGSASSPSGNTAKPTLYFMYAMNCTFTILDDTGKTVSAIPPGNYQVEVRTPVAFGTVPLSSYGVTDMTACKGMPQFQLTGPGINLSTTMTAGCQSDLTFPETFQPNATYTAVDNNQPTLAKATLTTLASGTPATPTATYGATTSTAQSSTDLVGSGVIPFRGTLTATLGANGKPTLTKKGKAISTLPVGSYTFAVTDQDPNGGFAILGPTKVKTTLTGVKFVGKHSATVVLKAGRWTYLSGLGQIHYFVVAN